jgi:TRAP-type mannitol/chloroaromatic compound transport system permease large subunit
VLSVGTLFQAALLPGIFLAGLYGAYAFGFALLRPDQAPPVVIEGAERAIPASTAAERWAWFAGVPVAIVAATVMFGQIGVVGSQAIRSPNTPPAPNAPRCAPMSRTIAAMA